MLTKVPAVKFSEASILTVSAPIPVGKTLDVIFPVESVEINLLASATPELLVTPVPKV